MDTNEQQASICVNARISSTSLGFEDHGILTCWLMLEFEASGQGFGSYVLDDKPLEQDRGDTGYRRQPSTLCGRSITGILSALELDKWEKLPGTYVRVRRPAGSGRYEELSHIGHIIKDRWFSFAEAARAKTIAARGPSAD